MGTPSSKPDPSKPLARLPAGQQIQTMTAPRVLVKVHIENLHIHPADGGNINIGDAIKTLIDVNDQESDQEDY